MPATTITGDEVREWTGVTVPDVAISVAATAIEDQTGYTVDAHVDSRAIPDDSVRLAWALVAVRVDLAARHESAFAVTGESQEGYSYTESATLAVHERFRSLLDGRPSELLNIPRAAWAHI